MQRVLVLNHESNWEDSINHNLAEIVKEITNTENYATELDGQQKLMLEAYCRQSLREKMLENYKKLVESIEISEEGDDSLRQQIKDRVKQMTIYRTLDEKKFEIPEALIFA